MTGVEIFGKPIEVTKPTIVVRPRIGLAIAFGILLGTAGTLTLLRLTSLPEGYVIQSADKHSYRYSGAPSAEQLVVGAQLRDAGQRALTAHDLEQADLFFGQCIEVADLSACHARLASVLYLTRDQSAHAHYKRSLAPPSP